MPYITPEQKSTLAYTGQAKTPGELNYLITELIVHYVACNKNSYTTYNNVLGALEGAKLEFYRRIVVPYEEKKRLENGDVY